MDPATVSAVVNHQRAESKLSGGKLAPSAVGNGSNDTNLLINFGLPRPTAARSRHTSAANSIDETLRDTANDDGALDGRHVRPTGGRSYSVDDLHDHLHAPNGHARPTSLDVGSQVAPPDPNHHHHHRRHHHHHQRPRQQPEVHRRRRESKESSESNFLSSAALLSNMATGAHMRSADAHSQHSFEPQSGARVAAPTQQRRPNSVAAPPAHYRSEHLPLERHRRHRYDDWELYQSSGGVVGNDVPYTISRMNGDDVLRSAAAPPSGKFTGTLSYFEAFDDQGEIQEPMVSKYPHLQIREVTAERHYSDGWLGCGAKRTERILDSVSFELRGGELLAILGTADSGVASLISILTGNPSSKSSNFGEIIVNGNRVRLRELRSMVAYMRSDDALIPYLTVEQFLTMYARLKYASNTSMQERKRTIDYFLENARLHQFRKRLIASLAVDQRKLLQLVCQLMLDTDFIVLEEPTSGLEPSWARFVVEYMQDFVARGRIAIMTINQPTFDMFKFFTKVALISDGQLLYFGSNRNLMPYFSSIRYPCPPLTNPCDYYVDLITIDYDSIQTTEESTERVRKLAELHAQTTLPLADPGPPHVPPAMYKQANVFQQFGVLIRLMSYRVASLDTAWVLLLVAILSLFVGLIFSNIDLQLQNNSSFPNISQLSIDDRFGFIFVMAAIATLPELLRIIASVNDERLGLCSALNLQLFHSVPYYCAKIAMDIFPFLLTSFLYVTPAYWLSSMRRDVYSYAYYLGVMMLYLYSIRVMAITVTFMFSSGHYAARVSYLVLAYCGAAAGFVVHYDHTFRIFQWSSNSSSTQWAYRLVAQNEFSAINFNRNICTIVQGPTIITDPVAPPIQIFAEQTICTQTGAPVASGAQALAYMALPVDDSAIYPIYIPMSIMAGFAAFFLVAGCVVVPLFGKRSAPPDGAC